MNGILYQFRSSIDFQKNYSTISYHGIHVLAFQIVDIGTQKTLDFHIPDGQMESPYILVP